MAFYILINKITDNSEYTEYSFGETETNLGIFRINNKTGEIFLVSPAHNDTNENLFHRAALKILRIWKRGEPLPDKTCWAS